MERTNCLRFDRTDGFNTRFDRMKKQELVLAAMAIEGVHHTWHSQLG
jgi:hypothetical protein